MNLLLLFLLLLTSCNRVPPKPPEKSYPVHITEVFQKDVPIKVETIGNITPPQIVQVRPQITGKLQSIEVMQGSFVKAGQLLFIIEPEPFQAALDRALAILKKDEANWVYAKDALERYSKLVDQNYVSQLNYAQIVRDAAVGEAQVMQDRADVELAQINLDYCYIRAPWDGRIGFFNAFPGNIVSPTDAAPLTQLRQIIPIEVDFTISQEIFQKLKELEKDRKFVVEAYLPGEKTAHIGSIASYDNNVDLTTGTLGVKANFDNKDLALWPGEFVRVSIEIDQRPNAILVPTAAVQIGQQGHYAFVLNNEGRVDLRVVEVGGTYQTFTIVNKGLSPGEKVVTDGQINLKQGSKVTVQQGAI